MKLLVCNLKNKLNRKSNANYSEELSGISVSGYQLVVAPSMPFMSMYDHRNYILASQDITSFTDKTITGEVTGEQLSSIGCKYVLVGHSERRINNGEININFINKITNAQESGIGVIYCIGETLSERNGNHQYNSLEQQISEVLNNVSTKNIVIAYEPMYAIGGGYKLTNEEIEDTIQYIKDITFEKYEERFKVLYGGGVNEEVLARIKNIDNIDGYLVGSASADIDGLKKMITIISGSK